MGILPRYRETSRPYLLQPIDRHKRPLQKLPRCRKDELTCAIATANLHQRSLVHPRLERCVPTILVYSEKARLRHACHARDLNNLPNLKSRTWTKEEHLHLPFLFELALYTP